MSREDSDDPTFTDLLESVKRCRLCDEFLPLGPRPVVQLDPRATILIAGQAPGRRVHESGVPFDDPSGERLREWLGISRDIFYDATKVAILPMGFCYPGTGKSGDLPPRPECEKAWRQTSPAARFGAGHSRPFGRCLRYAAERLSRPHP